MLNEYHTFKRWKSRNTEYTTTQHISSAAGVVFHLFILVNWIKILLELHANSFRKPTHQNPSNLYLCQVQKSYWITWRKRFSSLSLCFSPFSTTRFLNKDFGSGTNRSHMPGSEQHPVKVDRIFVLPKTSTLKCSSFRLTQNCIKSFHTSHFALT